MPQARIAGARGTTLRASGLALVLGLAAFALAPPGLTLARGAATIPDEPGAFRLDGPSYSALVADVDGDGQPELVRLTTGGIDENQIAVEIWRQASDGTWSITGPAAPLHRGRSPDEDVSAAVDPDSLAPLLVDDPGRLMLWRQGGRMRVLVAVSAGIATSDRGPCCLTIWEVTHPRGGGAPSLRLLVNTHRGGDTVFAVDMDGDGTDELAVREPPGSNTPAAFSVLRWSAGRFTVITRPLNAGNEAQPYRLGNSDGRPGDEIGLIGTFGPGATGYGLTRVSLRAGAIHAETTEIPSGGVLLPVAPVTGSGAASIMLGDQDQSLVAFSWQADGDMSVVARSSRRGQPVGVIGSGSSTRIMLRRTDPPALDLIAPDLSQASVEAVRPADAAKPFFAETFSPYIGPWPNPQSGGMPAQVYAGILIRSSAGPHPDFAAMAVLPGMAPLGELGRAGAWTALAQRTAPAPRAAEVEPRGGTLLQNDDFSITLAPTADVLAPEADGGAIRPVVEDAVVDARLTTEERQELLIGAPVFEATVVAPHSSVAVAIAGGPSQVHPLLGSAKLLVGGSEIPGPPFRIPIVSSSGSSGNQSFDAALQVITPAGHGYTARWHVRLQRTAPKLDAEAPFLSLFSATITGRTDPTATVTAEGQSVRAGVDGHYRLNVPAGFVPRDVRVQARDPIGNQASVTVSVVAPLDYRRLPWIPIMVILTVAIGAVLFLRAPRLVARPSSGRTDEGTFEEIDADSPRG